MGAAAAALSVKVYTIPTPLSSTVVVGAAAKVNVGLTDPVEMIIFANGTSESVALA
jgi:hypothetical protein